VAPIEIEASPESRAEVEITKEIVAIAVPKKDAFTEMFENLSLRKTLRVCAWIATFLANCKSPKPRRTNGPSTTDKIKCQEAWWTERAQAEATCSETFLADKLQLNLGPRDSGILECRGRIIGGHTTYLPGDNLFTSKFVQQAHLTTLHAGVTLTMTKVRETHSVTRLRRLTKKVIKSCWGYKRFQAQAYHTIVHLQMLDVEMPVLTPSFMLYLRPNQLPFPELISVHHMQETDLRKSTFFGVKKR